MSGGGAIAFSTRGDEIRRKNRHYLLLSRELLWFGLRNALKVPNEMRGVQHVDAEKAHGKSHPFPASRQDVGQ